MRKKEYKLYSVIGLPGAGKSTYACYLAKKAIKKGIPVYSNLDIKGTYKLDPKNDLGYYLIEDCLILIDEAGIEFNNRFYKSLSNENISFFKKYRHYKCFVYVFSQADDVDITIRRLCDMFLWIHPCWLSKKIMTITPVVKSLDIVDGEWKFVNEIKHWIFNKHIYMPPIWKFFDSFCKDDLPIKDFEVY